MLGPCPRRSEPTEAAVIAIVCRERAIRAIARRDMHAGWLVPQRALELERPRTTEARTYDVDQRHLVGSRAPDVVTRGARLGGDFGGTLDRDARIVAHRDDDVAARFCVALEAAFL